MKKTIMIFAVLLWVLAAQAAMAAAAFDFTSAPGEFDKYELSDGDVDVLDFRKTQFLPGQYLEVYSGPGENYYRCADGKASVSTDGDVLCAGRIGKWMMIEYWKNDEKTPRVGYIDSEKLKNVPDCNEIHFESIPVFMWSNTYLMDAPTKNSDCIAMLEARYPATLLAWHADNHGEAWMDAWSGFKGWAYIETVVDGKPVRGFIDPYSLDKYQIGDERMNIGPVTEEKLKDLYAFRYKFLKQGSVGLDGGSAAGLTAEGTICIAGKDHLPEMKNWRDIVAISMGCGFAVGLKSDGTVVATGCNEYGQCNVENWSNIVAISAGEEHTVGLKADGTVVMTGSTVFQQDSVKVWDNIVEIRAGGYHTVGLRADGAVLVAGGVMSSESDIDWTEYDTIHVSPQTDIELWNKVSIIDAQGCSTVGLRCDGTVLFSGDCVLGQDRAQEWRGIENIAIGWNSVYGVNFDGELYSTWTSDRTRGWYDVVFLTASDQCVLGVQRDRSVLHAEGWIYEDEMDEFKKMTDEIDQWNSIGLPDESAVFEF
ncbi:MAG: hypothetical protein J6M56_14310 [Clostridia bacterium]|nr:hypothetical protein [Clostridia bacterium]